MSEIKRTSQELAIIAQAKCLGLNPKILLRLPRDNMEAASYFPASPVASRMDKNTKHKLDNHRPSKRVLRKRKCEPPRITNK